jgi:hypothetical protein
MDVLTAWLRSMAEAGSAIRARAIIENFMVALFFLSVSYLKIYVYFMGRQE